MAYYNQGGGRGRQGFGGGFGGRNGNGGGLGGGFGSMGGGYGPLGMIVKGAAAGIGLASESIHHRRENKAAKQALSATKEVSNASSPPNSPPAHQSTASSRSTSLNDVKDAASVRETAAEKDCDKDEDEQQWQLDEAQDELARIREPEQKPAKRPEEHNPTKMVKLFTDAYPPPLEQAAGGLSLPVILPQRRPKDRTRGFIRAYAPVLQDCGIDEPMFMDFLETFNTATLASPWIDAINLASFAFMALPTGIGQAASTALAIAVSITKNMQSRHRHSYVLDQMNNDFYRPRGLYALILTWNPSVEDASIGIDLNEVIGQNMDKPHGIVDKTKHSFRPSMGNTNGVLFAEVAPLTFPHLESLTDSTHHEVKTNKEKLVLSKSMVADYFDRGAQAQYAGENPDSDLLVAPKPKFTSRYSDPNHPSNSGDLLGLLTAGKIVRPPRGGGWGGISGGLGNARFGRGQYYNQPGYGSNSFLSQRGAGFGSNPRFGPGYFDNLYYDEQTGMYYDEQTGAYYDQQTIEYYYEQSGCGGNQMFGQRGAGFGPLANCRGGLLQSRSSPGPGGFVGRGPGGLMGGGPRGMVEGGPGGMVGCGPGGTVGVGPGGMMMGGPGALLSGTVGRMLKKHVLYLAIVNMPSESELAEATRHLNQAEAQRQS